MANFSWSGTWQSNTYYEVNTFVKYDNIAYVSTNSFQGSTLPPSNDMTNWNVFVVGYQTPVSPTPTSSIPATPTETPTNTPTPTITPSHTPVGSPTNTPLPTETPTPTPTITNTPTPTITSTVTSTQTPTPTSTPTLTNTQTPTITSTVTSTRTPTPTTTSTSIQVTLTPSPTPILCYCMNVTFSQIDHDTSDNGTLYVNYYDCSGQLQTYTTTTVGSSFGPCAYSIISLSILVGGSLEPVSSSTASLSPTPCTTNADCTSPSPTNTPTVTTTKTPTPTTTPTKTPTDSLTPTVTTTPTKTPTNTLTPTVTTTPTNTFTNTPTPSTSQVPPSATPTNTTTTTPTPTKTPVPKFRIINNSTGNRTVSNVTGAGPWNLTTGTYPVTFGEDAYSFTHPQLQGNGPFDDQFVVVYGGTSTLTLTITKNGNPYYNQSGITGSQTNIVINSGDPTTYILSSDIIIITISD